VNAAVAAKMEGSMTVKKRRSQRNVIRKGVANSCEGEQIGLSDENLGGSGGWQKSVGV